MAHLTTAKVTDSVQLSRVPHPTFFRLGGDFDFCLSRSEIIVEFEINPAQHTKIPAQANPAWTGHPPDGRLGHPRTSSYYALGAQTAATVGAGVSEYGIPAVAVGIGVWAGYKGVQAYNQYLDQNSGNCDQL